MDFRELVKVGAHFGHIKSRLNPKMNKYIWGVRNNVHLIDVSKTAVLLENAAKFLESVSADGKSILWVGTKKAAKGLINSLAQDLEMPYVSHRWIGGTLSNYSQVRKSVTKLLHYEDILAKKEKYPHYTKKELNVFAKIVDRLKNNIGGIRKLSWPIGAVVLVDAVKELSALREALAVGVPVVAIVDTNGDPSLVDYVIPANDDSSKSIKFILDNLVESVQQGKKKSASKKKEDAEKKAVKDKEAKKPQVKAKEVKTSSTKEVKKVATKKTEVKKEDSEKKKEAPKKKELAKEKPVAKGANKKEVQAK